MNKPLITPQALQSALGLSSSRQNFKVGSTVIFNLLNQSLKSLGINGEAQSFYGASVATLPASPTSRLSIISKIGMGSAMMAFYFEMARHYGADRFLLLGQTGALTKELSVGQRLAPAKALAAPPVVNQYVGAVRAAATSATSVARPSHEFTNEVCAALKVEPEGASVWSTDAIFQETHERLEAAREAGAIAVDMETATFFALAEYLKVAAVAVLVVTDELALKAKSGGAAISAWRPQFRETAAAREQLLKDACAALSR